MRLKDWIHNNKLLVSAFIIIMILLIVISIIGTKTGCQTKDAASKHSVRLTDQVLDQFTNYRLPQHVVPKNYKLILKPNMINKTFEGIVTITVNVLRNTKQMILHSNKLNIEDVKLDNAINKSIEITHGFSGDAREFFYVDSKESIVKAKQYSLKIKFSGRLDKRIVGLYSSKLKKGGTMMASKFQPTYTRQAFPCFDEPGFKATFDTTILTPSTHLALSNMNEISKTRDPKSDMNYVTFATSVPMSTYLACFVICDFAHKEVEIYSNSIGKNFKLRTFAQRDQMHKIDFALDIGRRAVEFYIKYYEVPFPLPKLDMIAIPDYQSGATEHWGLITYRETSFLIDPATSSARNKNNVANTVAHELAHMWFGNLVTLEWWNDLWLNEGFATFMQKKALNAIEPSWTMLDLFLTETLHKVMDFDAKLSSHPIVQKADTPDQITAIFDIISYNKGASVLRMIENFIGEKNFRKGISDYLKRFKFSNTVTQDLYNHLEPYFKESNPDLNLTYIVGTWTRQMGYPVLSVTKDESPNTYVITQTRFLLDSNAKIPDDLPFNYRWYIPITYSTNKGASHHMLWFPNNVEKVKLIINGNETLMKINNNQIGYYRVNYTIDMWKELIRKLKDQLPQLTISDRAHLINDVFALAESKQAPYELALNLTTYLAVEEDYVPWEVASSVISSLKNKLYGTLAYYDLQKYTQSLISHIYQKQSWKTSSVGMIESHLRVCILGLATKNRLPEAEKTVKALLLEWLNKHGTPEAVELDPDLRDLIYYTGMKSATMAEWEKLWEIYLKEEDAQERAKLIRALAAPNDPTLLSRYLQLAWDEKYIRSQDYLTVLNVISANPSGTEMVWRYVRTQWPGLVKRFTLNSRYLGKVIPTITFNFNTELQLKEMEDFFEEYPEAGAGELARRSALETVRNNIQWIKINQQAVADWLKDKS